MRNQFFLCLTVFLSFFPKLGLADIFDNGFQTPSGNIICFSRASSPVPTQLQCLVFENTWNKPELDGCGLDETHGIVLPTRGMPAEESHCHGDVWWPYPLATLGYGSTWELGGIGCEIKESGVTCKNQSQNGFEISRSAVKLF